MKKNSHQPGVALLLHNIRSVHNVGSIFRTADAAGVGQIFLSGYTPQPKDRFGRDVPELSKVALGGERMIPWQYEKNPKTIIERLKKSGFDIVGLEQDERSIDYKKYTLKKSTLLIVGNEVLGISPAVKNLCDTIIEIPMKGKKESLNVAVSTGIALFRLLDR